MRLDEAGASRIRLFLLGFLTLFLELVLIRFLAGNIWNLGYFPNLVLLGVFVGMGTGFVFHHLVPERRSHALFEAAGHVLLLLVAFVYLVRPAVPGFETGAGLLAGEAYYTAISPTAASSSLWPFLLWFLCVILVFALISQRTAKLFAAQPPLLAYTLDIAGSCCGILFFMAASWLQLPAWLWFLLLVPVVLLVCQGAAGRRLRLAASFAVIAAIAWRQDQRLLRDPAFQGDLVVRWSPYQKVECAQAPGAAPWIFVNGINHQAMYGPALIRRMFYQAPHDDRARRGLPPYRSVLVIGAGGGNDVASALMNQAERVDAVEIDPVILQLGRERHPARPYDDPRVHVSIGDGRAFMTRADRKYDLVVFALTDSVVKVSPMAQLRLENYLFTVDAARRAFSLLTESGDLVFYNQYRFPWVRDKLRLMLARATGRSPRTVFERDDFSILAVGPQAGEADSPASGGIQPATDDWPFPYLRERAIPDVYRRAMAILGLGVLLLGVVVRAAAPRDRPARPGDGLLKAAFLLMGTAFLLLETKSVIQFSLLFGTTWLNNSLVFLAILALVLLANWTALLVRRTEVLPLAYLLLLGFCAAGFAFPLGNLLHVASGVERFLLASLLTFAPIFFANLIFSVSFRNQPAAERLFGWNLIGATLGGVLEYTSMLLGYNALSVIVGVCYTAVFGLILLAQRRAAGVTPAPAGEPERRPPA